MANHEQWRRGTRRDAYAGLVVALQKQCDILRHTPRADAFAEDADEYVTPAMEEARRKLTLKAIIVRFEGPETMRDLAIESEKVSFDLLLLWQATISHESSVSLEDGLHNAELHVERIMHEAENILGRRR